MTSTGRTLFPYLAAGAMIAAVVWSLSFGTLERADFTFVNSTEIKSVDPAMVTGQPEGRIIRTISEGLLGWDPETLAPVPGVAASYDVSDDKKTYTFHLRDDAAWSNGEPVTADDFSYSFRRFLHPEIAAEYAYLLWDVVGAEDFSTMRLEVGQPVEIELLDRPEGALPFAPGRRISGVLKEVIEEGGGTDGGADNTDGGNGNGTGKVYVVDVGGTERRFRRGDVPSADDDVEACRWVLRDFETVGIRAPDDHTLEITLKHPVLYFDKLMGFYPLFPVNRTCVETYGYPAWTKPEHIVSNGPFQLKFRRIRDRIRMEKNPHYWGRDDVSLETIDALAVESVTTALNMYMTGEVDYVPEVPRTILQEIQAQGREDFSAEPFLANYHYLFNVEKPPLDDVRVRRAINMAINKQEIVDTVTQGGEIPARSIVPPMVSGYSAAECDAYDPEAARALLAEAGYPGGKGFPTLEILYNTHETHQTVAELIQAQLRNELGINVGLRNEEWGTCLNSRRTGDFMMCRAGWIADYDDPNTFLDMFMTSNPNNHTRWSDEEYDRLLEEAAECEDPQQRMQMLHDAEAVLMSEMPVVPLYQYVRPTMVQPYVKGFYNNALDVHPLKYVSIDKELKRELAGH
ncbi:MAG: peptide ABC transporter substrate-binding protein [Planctomycetales bacterium]|nr:peptide ABC transporter substrate-binding protein [Planctomycetales bacterium]